MANQILTRQEITRESLMDLSNNTIAIPRMTRDLDQEFGKKGGKIGDTIYVRKPARAVGRDGSLYQPEAMVDTQVPITINQQSGVDFQFSSVEKYLSIDEMRSRYLKPYMLSLANKLDSRALQMAMVNTANLVGTVGTVPGLSSSNAFLTWAQAGQKLDEMGFPLKGRIRCVIVTPAMRVGWISYNAALNQFNPQSAASAQWKTGQISDALGMEWYVDQNVPSQTIGALGGTPAVNGAGQTGNTLITDGWTASTATLAVGDNFTQAGVYAVNPQSRVSTGALQDFVVQALGTADSGGNMTITFTPAMVPSGQFQNVSNSPADNALISVYHVAAAGQSALAGVVSPQGLVFDKEAFAFVSFPGDVPEGVDMSFEDRDEDTGISLRFVREWIGATDQWVNRFDVYYGSGPLYQEGSVRVAS